MASTSGTPVLDPASAPGDERDAPNPWLALIAVALGVMMVALDGTVVSVANPTIGRDLDASLSGLQWVTNGYLLALAVLLVLGGKLGDRFGRRRVFAVGIAGFALTSAGCALSQSTGMLVAFRVLQGVAGAMLMPNSLAILRAAFPPHMLDKAVGIWGGSTALATASGPIIGGLLVEHVSWESIFLINVPMGALALAVTLVTVRESRDEVSGKGFDPPGVLLLTGGLFTLIWAIIKSQDHGWGSAYVLAFLAAAVVLLAGFVARETRARSPLIPLSLFRSVSLSAGVVMSVVGFLALFGVLFFVTLYLQRVNGYSPVEAGVRMLPLTGVFALSAPLGGVLTEKLGPRVPLAAGMGILGIALLGLRGLQVGSGYGEQWPWFLAIGVALGLVVVASTQAIVGNAPVERGGIAGGLQTTAQQLGGVLGTSVLGAVIVGKVNGSLASQLGEAGVPASVANRIAGSAEAREAVSQGVAPVPPGAPRMLAERITDGTFETFVDGLHAAMLVGAAVSFVGVLLALLVKRGHSEGGTVAAA